MCRSETRKCMQSMAAMFDRKAVREKRRRRVQPTCWNMFETIRRAAHHSCVNTEYGFDVSQVLLKNWLVWLERGAERDKERQER